jgi:5-formyltetrahydrofolate cyclo-ligase
VSDDKKRLRAQYRERRRNIPSDEAAAAAQQIALRVTRDLALPAGAVVAGYWPFPDELDPRPWMDMLHARGHRLCLPVVADRDTALEFRAWAPGEPLIEAVFGTRVPQIDRPTLVPQVLLVPLLAFDRDGYRLGYGGGYYDRTLAAMAQDHPISIGLAFASQEINNVPHEAHDRRLDWVMTERAVHRIT